MASIYDFINAPTIGTYWETVQSNSIPYMGTALFPAKRMKGLRLEWIKGKNNLPVMLMPSAFDARPTLRDRGGIETMETRMPFFREAMRIGEEDRQNLLTFLATNPAYAQTIISKIFDDAAALIDSATLNAEVMRFELIQTGGIAIASPNASGVAVNYNYNYDVDGSWKAENVTILSGTKRWGEADSNPIMDLFDIRRRARAKGVNITRAICSPAVWAILLTTSSIALELDNKTAVGDAELQSYLLKKTGITFSIYEKMYTDFEGVEHSFMMDDRIIFLPAGPIGTTYYGTTPEEADLLAGETEAKVRIVNGGISVVSLKQPGPPVNVETWVSEIVLPSFEGMNKDYILKVV